MCLSPSSGIIGGGVMIRIAFAFAAFIFLSALPAAAADLPVKAPLRAPPAAIAAVYDWTGWYGGIDAGAARTDNTVTDVNGDQSLNPGDKLNYSRWGFAAG